VLERDGHEVKITDFPAIGLDVTSLKRIIGKDRPDFAIWSAGTPTIEFDLGLARIIKETAPQTITGVIGTHVSVLPEEALNTSSVDVVIRGEPERAIRSLCLHEERRWDPIDGISYRDPGSGKIHHNPDSDFLSPEDIPFPAWHHLDIRPYRLPLKGRRFLIVAPTRGCPYPCNFCTAPLYYGKRLRRRPIKEVVDEIEANMGRYNVRDFFIWADTFTADKRYVIGFCREIIERRLDISWTCNSRVDTVDREILLHMKEAGLWMISFGLESGNDEILNGIGKNIAVEQSRVAVSAAHRLGLKTSGHFMLGLPGETEKTMRQTLALAMDLPLDIAQFYAAAPFPGTGLYELTMKGGCLRRGTPLSQSRASVDLPGLPAEKVDEFRRYAYRRFYLRPGAFLRLFSMLGPDVTKNVNASIRGFFHWAT
jgi:radical SAM superfamily enzyme YgiQ (UPF0313 family)